MTVVSKIISDAYRLTNLTALGTAPNLAQQNEGLDYLNRLVKSVYGYEAGEPLQPIPIGRNNIERPQGFPYFEGLPDNNWVVPVNHQLMLNLTSPLTFYLHPMPQDGARLALSDLSGNLSTNPATLVGNGRKIEGQTSLVINTDNVYIAWFYRADTGSWERVTNLTISDNMPFPEEFDDMFIILLAARINPSYAQGLDEQSSLLLRRLRTQFRARYKQVTPVNSEAGLIVMPHSDRLRDRYADWWYDYDPSSLFNVG